MAFVLQVGHAAKTLGAGYASMGDLTIWRTILREKITLVITAAEVALMTIATGISLSA
jgi:hypothetical protein